MAQGLRCPTRERQSKRPTARSCSPPSPHHPILVTGATAHATKCIGAMLPRRSPSLPSNRHTILASTLRARDERGDAMPMGARSPSIPLRRLPILGRNSGPCGVARVAALRPTRSTTTTPRLGGGSWRTASPDPKQDGLDACAMTRSSQQPWPATRRSKHLKTTRWAAWQHGEKGPRSNDGDKGRGSPAM